MNEQQQAYKIIRDEEEIYDYFYFDKTMVYSERDNGFGSCKRDAPFCDGQREDFFETNLSRFY